MYIVKATAMPRSREGNQLMNMTAKAGKMAPSASPRTMRAAIRTGSCARHRSLPADSPMITMQATMMFLAWPLLGPGAGGQCR